MRSSYHSYRGSLHQDGHHAYRDPTLPSCDPLAGSRFPPDLEELACEGNLHWLPNPRRDNQQTCPCGELRGKLVARRVVVEVQHGE
jgi:hypothetical protein